MPEEGDAALDEAHARPPLQRRALQVMIANGQAGIVSRSKGNMGGQGKADLQAAVDVGGMDDTNSHRDDSSPSLAVCGVP